MKPRGQEIPVVDNVAGPCPGKPVDERCISCILDSSDYFSALNLEVKRALQEFLQFKSFDRRALLYREGRPGENLFILMSGEVKVYKSLSNGRQQIHKLAVIPGDLIACEDHLPRQVQQYRRGHQPGQRLLSAENALAEASSAATRRFRTP